MALPKDSTPDLETVRFQMKVGAIQFVVTTLVAEMLRTCKDREATFKQWKEQAEQASSLMVFPGVDAAVSDMASQEFRDFAVSILSRGHALAAG
jgi:hypothetical protein